MYEAIKLWFEYRDKDINYKNWWNIKDNIEGGILNKDFIKKHLQRETELEDKVFELENKIKELKEFKTKALKESIGVDDIGARLLTKIAMRMQINLEHNLDSASWRINTPTLSVDDILVDYEEIEYLRSLVEPQLESKISTKIANIVPSSNTYADNFKYLADDRASCYVNDMGKIIGFNT